MRIDPVDHDPNLYTISDVYSADLVTKILATPWLEQPWRPQPNQESWPRRRIDLMDLPWCQQWEQETRRSWFRLSMALQRPLLQYSMAYTYFWVDMPGFTCGLHTDGHLAGAVQLAWHGSEELATRFYTGEDRANIRLHKPFVTNTGYVMVNRTGQMHETGLWHDMPVPVPENQYRVTSYTLLMFL